MRWPGGTADRCTWEGGTAAATTTRTATTTTTTTTRTAGVNQGRAYGGRSHAGWCTKLGPQHKTRLHRSIQMPWCVISSCNSGHPTTQEESVVQCWTPQQEDAKHVLASDHQRRLYKSAWQKEMRPKYTKKKQTEESGAAGTYAVRMLQLMPPR